MISFVKNKILVFSFLFFLKSSSLLALHCSDIRSIITFYLKTHYSVHNLSDDVNKHVLQNYMRSLDPLKTIFFEKDRKEIEGYAKGLSFQLAKNDCSRIDKVYAIYAKNFEKKFSTLKKVIGGKFNYNKDEYIDFDRKNASYPKNEKERDDLWRRIIKYQLINLEEALGDEKKAKEKLIKRYELKLKDHKDQTLSEVYERFLNAIAGAFDPHTSYFPPKDLEDFNIATRLSLYGIGAALSGQDGKIKVESFVPGGPAQKGGLLKVKDHIIAVAQGKKGAFTDVIDMNLRDAVSLIRGAVGTLVRLKVRRGKKTLIIPIIREKISIESQAAKSTLFDIKVDKKKYSIGLIDLPSFYIDFQARAKGDKNFKSSTRDIVKEIEVLKKKKMDLLILDLRSNGGGALDEAISLSGLFTGKKPIVQIKTQVGLPERRVAETSSVFKDNFPIILMVNRQSASSSEIVAGALKDYDRALLVGGEHTFGKGTVQNFITLEGGLGAVKFTFSKFYRPLGSSTQLKGVYSHLSFPGFSDHYEIGEKYYPNPLSWDSLKPEKIKNFNMVKPYLKKLEEESLKRRKKEGTFDEIEKALKELEEKGVKKKISLKKEKKKADPKEKVKKTKVKDKKKVEAKDPKETVKKDSKIKKEDKKDSKKENKTKKEDKKKKSETDVFAKKEFKPDLNKDPYLLETVYIAADYIRLLKKEKFGKTVIEGFKLKKKEDKKKKAKVKPSKGLKSDKSPVEKRTKN